MPAYNASPFGSQTTADTHLGLQVRRLICLCLCRLYEIGDTLPMYACVSDLLGLLAGKEAKTLPEPVKTGALQCLAGLCASHGRVLAASMPEMLALAIKQSSRRVLSPIQA